jgi:hypothetical protein
LLASDIAGLPYPKRRAGDLVGGRILREQRPGVRQFGLLTE